MNPCPPVPEPVFVEGFTQYNAHFKFVEGGNESRLMRHTHASGVGLVTGAKYQFLEMWKEDGSYNIAADRLEAVQTTRYHVISEGSLGNFFMTMKQKVVYQDGRLVSAEVISAETDCRG
jgi:hypothetical protein